ncbi:O-antigen polysaccharide polymerase Wzy [Plantactinospora sp. B6F1]|uniref:O-antigen polysaccharide polymerase Wzy n=1 Tax=Plantactinospora sp. B6F1 TaxID=3158971 RepID=UPI00102C3504
MAVHFVFIVAVVQGSFQIMVFAAAVAVAALGAVVGCRRSRLAGHVDPFHPLLFPSIYVAVACLAPPLWLSLSDIDLGYLESSLIAPESPQLMALAVLGFTLGAAIPFARRVALADDAIDPRLLERAGMVIILVPLGFAAHNYLNKAVLTRGIGQDTVTLMDSISVVNVILGLTAVILILVARFQQGKSVLSVSEGSLVAALVALSGLNGQRHSALAILIAVLVFMTRRRGASIRAVLGLSAILIFAYVVVLYRVTVILGPRPVPVTSAFVQDLGSVTFTTGITATLMSGGPYLDGATIFAGLIRQLPGPVANSIFGPPVDTGAFQFRLRSGLTSDSTGYGFSLPAEGVINFGTVGAFIVPFVAGVLIAWIYARFSPLGGRSINVLYAVVASTLPYGFRSDTLGAVKGVLYPGVLLGCAFAGAAAAQRARRRRPPAVRTAPGRYRSETGFADRPGTSGAEVVTCAVSRR